MTEEIHDYRVTWAKAEEKFTVRHYALQTYIAMRKQYADFGPANEAIVRIYCDGVEYFNEDEKGPGRAVHGGSARQLTGTVRPHLYEKQMP